MPFHFQVFQTMKILRFILITIALMSILLVLVDQWVIYKSKGRLYSDISLIPKKKVGLLLGTSKYQVEGGINPYYAYRIDAAITLYKAGKIEYILISGDNSHLSYNEPYTFKKDLVARGIPENKIVLDYAGFRTLDSVIRAKKIFGQDTYTVISQKFHNERAIYLAESFDIPAIAFNARDVGNRYGLKTRIREYFARTKATIDVLFNVKPKFLGEEVPVG